ncbi:MAG: HAD-IIB family hydrolase [Candidatus Helarchaeota archaeon]|nr:HAD-IIB family hydrolase [Candidatus Helarchaeota archaeon]
MYIVFSDLDGTLLDNRYKFDEAEDGLDILRDKNIPLILCSSKTRLEIEEVRFRLRNNEPFIVENGGAIFIPEDYFEKTIEKGFLRENYWIIEIGLDYSAIRKKFQELKQIVSCSMRGFSDMNLEEISDITELSIEDAEKASRREYSEPFILDDETEIKKIEQSLLNTPYFLTRGARFFHLMGPNDKGMAVRILADIYQKNYVEEPLITIGIGDSKNDIPMLENVTHPFAVQKVNGRFDQDIMLLNVKLMEGIGPKGWNEVIFSMFS